jgi:hypothetical protein
VGRGDGYLEPSSAAGREATGRQGANMMLPI